MSKSISNTPPIKSEPLACQKLSDREASELVSKTNWYHSFVLRPGLKTLGHSDFDAIAACDSLYIPKDLRGKKCLDVGAWDGPLTFELERRGASAFALDIQEPNRVGFDAARRVLGSKAVHYQGSVYQLPYDEMTELDLVAFRGVYYHLKYPLLAFECISAALKVGGSLHFEGEAFLHYAEDMEGNPVDLDVAAFNAMNVPLCLCYPNRYKKSSNWFIPNPACLQSWLIASGFELREMRPFTEGGAQRLIGWAVKTSETSFMLEHPLY